MYLQECSYNSDVVAVTASLYFFGNDLLQSLLNITLRPITSGLHGPIVVM